MNINIKSLLVGIILLLIYNCASQGYPIGGPVDDNPPKLISSNPKNHTIELDKTKNIILSFDEMINPESIYNSITIEPNITFKIINVGNKIKIIPTNSWPEGMFKIIISRTLSDYNNNYLDKPIELLYSTSSYIPSDSIAGQLYNINSETSYSITLFDKKLNLKYSSESDNNGRFIINGIDNINDYLVLALEGKISDNILDDIRNKRYGISNSFGTNHSIYISEPLWNLTITNAYFINDSFGIITLSNNEKMYFLIDNIELEKFANISDSFIYINSNNNDYKINLNLKNLIEEYTIKYDLTKESINKDTISPSINFSNFIGSKFILDFSEPILINKEIFPFYLDDNSNVLGYSYISPKKIEIDIEKIQGDKFSLNCLSITDLSENNLCDSIITIPINQSYKNSEYSTGNLEILINSNNTHTENFILELEDITTGRRNKYKVINKKILINDLMVGDYKLWMYKDYNIIDNNYFSGTLEPLVLSAPFTVFDKIITIRSNWTNSIGIDFKE